MLYVPIIGAWMLVTGVIGLILIAIGKAFRWVLLATFLFLCTQVSMAEEVRWQLVFIREGEFVEHDRTDKTRRDCVRRGYIHMAHALNDSDDPKLEGFVCDRIPPRPIKKTELPVCTEPIDQCA